MKKFICLLLVLVITFCLAACGGVENETVKTYPPATKIEAETIFNDYYNNQLTAEEKHIGQRYKIIDLTVYNIREEYVCVTEKTVSNTYYLYLKYDASQLDYVKSLSKGDLVAFEGTLTDMIYPDIFFENIIFVDSLY